VPLQELTEDLEFPTAAGIATAAAIAVVAMALGDTKEERRPRCRSRTPKLGDGQPRS